MFQTFWPGSPVSRGILPPCEQALTASSGFHMEVKVTPGGFHIKRIGVLVKNFGKNNPRSRFVGLAWNFF